MKNYIQPGEVIDYIATAPVLSGEAIALGGLIAVAQNDAAAGAQSTAHISGVFMLPKVASAVIKQGDLLLFKKTAKSFDAPAGVQAAGDVIAGAVAFEDAGSGTLFLRVKLTGIPGTVKV